MSLDGLFLYALTHELAATFIGGRITKIHQPNSHDIVLAIRSNGQNHKLLLSAHPAYPRVHTTAHSSQNPLEPPMFCMLLRKHCEGGFIESVQQVGLERILHIDVRSRDELGDEATRRIIVEIMGRHSNIILTDPAANQILDSIHHVTPAVSRHRIVLPGRPYQGPPEQGKLNPMSVTHDKFISLLDLNQGKIEKQLVHLFTGISPLLSKEILHQAGLPKRENLWNAFSQVISLIERNDIQPQWIESDNKSYYYVLPLLSVEGKRVSFNTISALLDAFFQDKAETDAVKQRASDLSRFLTNEYEKNEKKIGKLRETLQQAVEAEKYRVYGELLTANLYQIKRGDQEARVINFYEEDPSEVTIVLDPQLTPSQNAQRYFKKFNKAKNSVAIVEEQVQKAQEEMVYLETIIQQIETASLEDIEDIREELVDGGYLRNRNRNRKDRRKKKNDKPTLSVYYSSEGFPIYVGKNNKQNDYLSQKLASAQDTWLHTKDIPGSHVIIRGREFGEVTLKEAAMIAAYFSKARSSSQVPVDYTLVKHVKKPNGAKPGYVIYDNQKTFFVTPEASVIKDIQNNIDKPKKN
jgi:predicted ribosome quality control (RQC) complex YloA/Tae2 family protein